MYLLNPASVRKGFLEKQSCRGGHSDKFCHFPQAFYPHLWRTRLFFPIGLTFPKIELEARKMPFCINNEH